jgi:PAS domain S-box-containing protein
VDLKSAGHKDFLAGGGEMAKLIREMDWSKTPLGPCDSWPPSLRTSIRIALDCAFPIVIWWGPELVILYNDEYKMIIGPAKHPFALGERGRKVWAEIWDVIGPMLSQVMERGAATRSRDLLLHVDRGYPEEAYFSFSYSPIYDETGKVAGIFCPVIETTEKIIGERRLRTLRDLAARCKGAGSEQAVFESASEVLAANLHDVPFAMIYGLDESEAVAHLQATAGISVSPVAPPTIALRETVGTWSLGSVAQSSQPVVIDGLSSQFGSLPTGAWNVAPQSAMVFPLVLPGQERPRAIMVAAVSPMRALDESYRTFFGLVATQIAAGLADAQALAEERKRAEALAELDRAKTAFFSNVSHEFRTPLTLMLGPLAESIANTKTPPEIKQRLQVSQRNSLRLLKLVNSLLDFSRIEAGRIQAVYEPTDLSALTAELASNFRSACAEAGLNLLVHCETVTESTYVDCEMWEKIVLNLISNAFKYTLAGEIEVALREFRESGAEPGFVELAVRDTGIGISEDELPKIFQRFYRIENARGRTHEGTGIGLSLVQELVALHGGTITVESVFGQGSHFKVRMPMGYAHLPAARIKANAPRAAASTRISAEAYVEEAMSWLPRAAAEKEEDSVLTMPTDGLIRAGHGARIIIADDNVDMRDYIRRLLAPNYRVETVADGGAALEAARREKPDLIVADVMMPVMDGFGLLRSVREDQELQTVPVIMLSARAGEESKVEGLAAGADDYLVKPFSARELLARVDAQLQMANVRGQTEKMLRQSEERFRTMADSSPIMIWMTDPAGKILFVNRTCTEFLGVTREQTRDLDYLQFIHPDDRDAYLAGFTAALHGRQTFHHQIRLQRFDGEWRWFESRGNPIFDGAGNMTGFIGSSPDITEIYQSQQALRELGQRKDEFLANMSHEIRSPLTAIMGYTDILLTRLEDPEDIECLRTIKESGDYLIEIINDILDLAKIEAGKLVLNCEPVSIHALLSEVQSLLNGRAKQKNLSLVLRYDGLLPEKVHTDRTRLRQILLNLVSNAIKFTERGKVEIVAKFSAASLLEIDVVDTGIGIAPEHQKILFQPFTQADTTSTRQYGGTGLGLAITRRLVEMLRGSVSFESEFGKGSRFRVSIPVEAATSSPNLDTGAELLYRQKNDSVDDSLTGRRILVVDDREEIRALVAHYITEAGGRVDVAMNGESAIQALEAAVTDVLFDAVVLDIQMPSVDGYETTRRLRAKGFRTPIIALTAGAMIGDREKCLVAGCDAYLTKPIDRIQLVRLIAQLVQNGRVASQEKPRKAKILLVDDSDAARELMTRFLKKQGYEIRSASDARSAIATAKSFGPDVVFLDIRLPDMTGYELLRHLKETVGGSATKFIGLSGFRAADSPQAAEFDHFLEKPVHRETLARILERL